jgi:hypothetical protein
MGQAPMSRRISSVFSSIKGTSARDSTFDGVR